MMAKTILASVAVGVLAAPSREPLFAPLPDTENCSNEELVEMLVPKIKESLWIEDLLHEPLEQALNEVVATTVNTIKADLFLEDLIKEPLLNGVWPGSKRPKIILAQDINYPPYAIVNQSTFELDGFAHDFAMEASAMNATIPECDIDFVFTETRWEQCWKSEEGSLPTIGDGLLNGVYHGCATYTHTQGVRNRFLDFTEAILKLNKAAGLLARLKEDGSPEVSPRSSLEDVRVADVAGWAPTEDGLAFVKNVCTGKRFENYDVQFAENTETPGRNFKNVSRDTPGKLAPSARLEEYNNANDKALYMLLSGHADTVWIYSDQADHYKSECDAGNAVEWDCGMWSQFGKTFAYIHTGMFDHAIDGTTLAKSKKGSGLKQILDPCILKFRQTKQYYELCQQYDYVQDCYSNDHFPVVDDPPEVHIYNRPTNEQAPGPCWNGYCSCDA